jgi:hypothetical protein
MKINTSGVVKLQRLGLWGTEGYPSTSDSEGGSWRPADLLSVRFKDLLHHIKSRIGTQACMLSGCILRAGPLGPRYSHSLAACLFNDAFSADSNCVRIASNDGIMVNNESKDVEGNGRCLTSVTVQISAWWDSMRIVCVLAKFRTGNFPNTSESSLNRKRKNKN